MLQTLPYRLSPLAGICIGEASNPGPPKAITLECNNARERAMAGLRALGLMRAAQDASTSDAESMPRVQTAPADQTDATAPADSSDADEEEL